MDLEPALRAAANLAIPRRRLLTLSAAAAACAAARPLRAQTEAILIGQSAPTSGPVAVAFAAPLAGQQLAIDDINRQGGIGGRPVRLILRDDAYDTERTVQNVRDLVEKDRVVALTGLGSTAGVGALLPYLAEQRMPLVGAGTGAHVLRAQHHPTFFTSQGSFKDEAEHALRTLATIQLDKVAVVYQDNPFGQGMLPVIEASAAQLGLDLVLKAPLAVDGSNAGDTAAALAQARPKAVYLVAVGVSVVAFVKATKARLNVPVYTLSVAANSVPALGEDARGLVITQIVPYPWRTVDPMARDFNRLAAAAQVPVHYGSYGGYLGARFLIEALQRAGPRITSDTLIRAIQGIRDWSLGGNLLSFGPDRHHGSSWAEITIVGNGGRFMR